jgi:hypothetical protein
MSTPLDFILEILTLRRGRYVCVETMATFGLQPSLPYYCSDWTTLVVNSLPPDVMMRVQDIRDCLFGNLNYCICFLQSVGPTQCQTIARQIQCLEHIGHGLLSDTLESPQPPPMSQIMVSLGHCMNMATHIRQYMHAPAHNNVLCRCIELGEALSTLCSDHRQACRAACISEGRGLVHASAPPWHASAPPWQAVHASAPPWQGQPFSLFKAPPGVLLQPPQDHGTRPCTVFGFGEHDPPDACCGIRPWEGGQRPREDGQPAPVLVRDEGERQREAGGGDPELFVGAWAPAGHGAVGEAVPARSRQRVASPRQAAVSGRADFLWATSGQRCLGHEEPGAVTAQEQRVGQRRRRADSDEECAHYHQEHHPAA